MATGSDVMKADLERAKYPRPSAMWGPSSAALGFGLPALAAMLPCWPPGPASMTGALAAGAALLGSSLGWQLRGGVWGRRVRPALGIRPTPSPAEDGLVLGITEDGKPFIWSRAAQVYHGFIVGKPGSGKTVLMMNLAFQKILRNGSVIFIDAKPSFHNLRLFIWMMKVAGRLEDFRALLPGIPNLGHTYNPLENGSDEGQTSLLTSLYRHKVSGEGGHWRDIHEDFLQAVVAALQERKRSPRQEGYHLGDVLAALASEEAQAELLSGPPSDAKWQLAAILKRFRGPDGALRREYFDSMSGLLTLLRKYVRGEASRVLLQEKGEINLLDLFRHRRVVYIGIPAGTASKIAWSYALLIAKDLTSVVGEVIGGGDDGEGRPLRRPKQPVLWCADEARAYMTEDLALALAQIREGGVAGLIGLQSISQMKGHVEQLDAQVLDMTALKIIFAQAGWDGAEAAALQLTKRFQTQVSMSSGSNDSRSYDATGLPRSSQAKSMSVSASKKWHYAVEPSALMEPELSVGLCYARGFGGHARIRTPLFRGPEGDAGDEPCPPPPPEDLPRYPTKAVRKVGLWEKYQRSVLRSLGKFIGEADDD